MTASDKPACSKAAAHTQAQRERILAAAQTCFVKSGFHAASMATIAETAEMSAGLIYRYFENKSAIILAIIEHQLTVASERIQQLHGSEDLVEGLLGHFDEPECQDMNSMKSALFLEMSAEATRDPQVAGALSKFDTTIREKLADWLSRSPEDGGYGYPPDESRQRALMLVCVIEGLKVRLAREPGLDKALLRNALAVVVSAITPAP